MKTWLLLYCKPRQESVAVRNLEIQGFRAYSPVITRRNPATRSRRRSRIEPLFPNYVFIHIDPNIQSISPVRSTKGVSHFVRFGDVYASASEEIMNQIRAGVAGRCRGSKHTFKQGDKLIVNGNGFNGLDAIFSSSCGNERVIILMDILGRETTVSVPVEYISHAGAE